MAKRAFSWLSIALLVNIVQLDRSSRGWTLAVWVRDNLNGMRGRMIDYELVGGLAEQSES